MDRPTQLLIISLSGYVAAVAFGLLFQSKQRLARFFSFGTGGLAALAGLWAASAALAFGITTPSLTLLRHEIPFIKFTVRLDPLGAFFLLVISLLSFALSAYSLGY